MLISGDFDEFKVVLDYWANAELFLGPRTQAYFGHPGSSRTSPCRARRLHVSAQLFSGFTHAIDHDTPSIKVLHPWFCVPYC